jgi:hypothetical protein
VSFILSLEAYLLQAENCYIENLDLPYERERVTQMLKYLCEPTLSQFYIPPRFGNNVPDGHSANTDNIFFHDPSRPTPPVVDIDDDQPSIINVEAETESIGDTPRAVSLPARNVTPVNNILSDFLRDRIVDSNLLIRLPTQTTNRFAGMVNARKYPTTNRWEIEQLIVNSTEYLFSSQVLELLRYFAKNSPQRVIVVSTQYTEMIIKPPIGGYRVTQNPPPF